MAQTVDHYGFHRDDQGIIWLHQSGGGTNALGRSVKSQIEVIVSKAVVCNHNIPVVGPLPERSHWKVYSDLIDDRAVELVEPSKAAPSGGHFFENPRGELTLHFVVLSRMTSPIHPIVIPVGMTSAQGIIQELAVTNCQPLIITGLTASHTSLIEDVCEAVLTKPRRLIMLGDGDIPLPPTVSKETTSVLDYPVQDIASLNWEVIGATVARLYMRNEPRDFDLEKRR